MTDPINPTSKRKPYNNLDGYIASRKNEINRGWVVIYYAEAQGFDPGGGKYVTVCEKHNTLCNTTSLKLARPFLKFPEFCEECMKEYYAKTGE